jgi:hypothetical protein
VTQVLVEVRVQLRLKDVIEDRLLALFFRLERLGIVKYFAVSVAQDVGRIPWTPSSLAFSPGAMMVLMRVCPVLRSLPARGVFVLAARATRAGISAVKFGAALAYGMPSRMAAYAYTMLEGIAGSFCSSARSKLSMV